MSVIELNPDDFTADRFQPVFDYVLRQEGDLRFSPEHFFLTWRQWMDMGFARTWASGDSATLGALFTRDIFGGRLRGQVVFWFALPEARHTGAAKDLFLVFEQAARELGCVDIQSAAHQKGLPSRREYQYFQHGFDKTETVFTKTL